MKSKPHDQAMAELYRKDPEFAAQVINSILEDGTEAELISVLRQVGKAQCGERATQLFK